jgi:hypothetical protein
MNDHGFKIQLKVPLNAKICPASITKRAGEKKMFDVLCIMDTKNTYIELKKYVFHVKQIPRVDSILKITRRRINVCSELYISTST